MLNGMLNFEIQFSIQHSAFSTATD